MPKRCEDSTHERRDSGAHRGRCIQCDAAANARYLAKPRTKARLRQYAKGYRARPGASIKRAAYVRKRRYGITESPSGLCAICGVNVATQVDHDHKTGRVRGFLCVPCNFHLGIVENDEWMPKARRYLREAAK